MIHASARIATQGILDMQPRACIKLHSSCTVCTYIDTKYTRRNLKFKKEVGIDYIYIIKSKETRLTS